MTQCFLITGTGRFRQSLRRYARADEKCKCGRSYHNADGPEIGIIELAWDAEQESYAADTTIVPRSDPRWPVKCDGCDYIFTANDEWQVFTDQIYVDAAGKEHSLRKPVPGMMWDAKWMGEWAHGPDGRCLVVITPSGDQWMIDGPASNCTMPNDQGPFDQAHRCWVRHGEPPNITVDKNGRTCAAGAGSIMTGNYHGFLQNGHFT